MAITSPMAGGILPFITAGDPNDPRSAQANAARAAAGNPVPQIATAAPTGIPGWNGAPITTKTTAPSTRSTSELAESPAFAEAKTDFTNAGESQVAVADREIERANKVNDSEIKRAENEQALLQQAAAQRAELERNREGRRQQMISEERYQQDAVDKYSKPSGYWQDMGAPRRIIAALALGAAAAVGAKEPFEVYQTYANEDRQRKMDRLKAESEKLLRMGKSREEVMAGYERQAAAIDRQEITNGKLLLKSAEIAARKLPGAALTAEKFKADLQADIAQKKIANEEKTLQRKEWHSGGTTTSTTEGKPEPGANAKPTDSENKYAAQADMIDNGIKQMKGNEDILPDIINRVSENVSELESTAEWAKANPLKAKIANAARRADMSPRSGYTGLEEKYGERGVAAATGNEQSNEGILRFLSGGAITGNYNRDEEARGRRGFSVVPGMSPEGVKRVIKNQERLRDVMRTLGGKASESLMYKAALEIADGKPVTALSEVSGVQKQPAQPQAAAPVKAARDPQMDKDVMAVLRKPNDPRAEAALRAAGREDLIPQLMKMRKAGKK
jgi:hypothetical protein